MPRRVEGAANTECKLVLTDVLPKEQVGPSSSFVILSKQITSSGR